VQQAQTDAHVSASQQNKSKGKECPESVKRKEKEYQTPECASQEHAKEVIFDRDHYLASCSEHYVELMFCRS
jgi:hypothetical protein